MKIKVFSLLLIALFVVPSALFGNVEVLEDTPSHLILKVETGIWGDHAVPGGTVPVPEGAMVDDRNTSRVMPAYRALVALPSERLPSLSILNFNWGDRNPGLPPMGTEPPRDDRLPRFDNTGPVVMGSPYRWRGRWVTDVYIIPLRLDNSGATRLDNITIKLTYTDTGSRGEVRADRLADISLVNPVAASRWTNVKTRRMNRAAFSWDREDWVRIELETEGIYEISRETLEQSGIDFSGLNPQLFRLFGNGGEVLSESVDAIPDSGLIENAILVEGENDGSWDTGDKIIFFGRSVNTWVPSAPAGEYEHTNNPFTLTNVYWLQVSQDGILGKRMEQLGSENPVEYPATIATSRIAIENDNFIFHSEHTPDSGKRWYAAELFQGEQYTTTFQVNSPVQEDSAKLRISTTRITSDGYASATVLINGIQVAVYDLVSSVIWIDFSSDFLVSGTNTFTLSLNEGHAMFDWFEVHYNRELTTTTDRIQYDRFPLDGTLQVSLDGLEDPYIFDVQDFENVKYTRSNPYVVESTHNSPRRYIAVSDGNFYTPTRFRQYNFGNGEYPNGLRDTNLGADYLFIVHEDFWDAAAELESYVEQRDNIEVIRVLVSDIYDEFAWGLFDPTAIRNFLRYSVEDWTGGESGAVPVACLLLGDGDYDYRNKIPSEDKNWIPPYENNQVTRDDWYAEISNSPDPQLMMSRLPFQSERELESYTERLQLYESEDDAETGAWHSRVVLVADDEYVETGPQSIDKQHLRYSDSLDVYGYIPSYMQVEKIYIGSYPTEFSPTTGERIKPLATQSLIDTYNRGALLINYMGHGNAHVWAHEALLTDSRDLNALDAGNKEPLIIAATCGWGHFDRPNNEAFFESLLGQRGGTLGVIAATRNTSGTSNFSYIKKFYEFFFDRTEPRSIGECNYLAKIASPGATNHYYHCFAEGMMVPSVPRLDVSVTNIEDVNLVALEEETIEGVINRVEETQQVAKFDNLKNSFSAEPVPDFTGEAQITVFDSYDSLTYVYFDGSEFNYRVPGGILFRGMVSVNNGEFESSFIVPRDVSYGSTDSWVQMFATDGQSNAAGSVGGIQISSVYPDEFEDTEPPEISVFFDHLGWREGDLTHSNPMLIIDLADSNGINLTGEIGHSIKAILDPGSNHEQTIDLTEDFIYERDSYQRGSAQKQLSGLSSGEHLIEIWAWDNANNVGRKQVSFITIDESQSLSITNVLNVPNPFDDRTSFTFDAIGADEATIKIYTASGRHIKTIGPVSTSENFNFIDWDGRDHYGDQVANGVYLYKVKVKGASGKTDEALGKLIRVR